MSYKSVDEALSVALDLHTRKGYALGHTQRKFLNDCTRELKERSMTPILNGHYISCSWSNPTCEEGVDTCYCARTKFILYELKTLVSETQNIPDLVNTPEEK